VELRPEDIEEILRVFAESDLEELHLEIGGTRLDLSKSGSRGRSTPPPSSVPASAQSSPAAVPAPGPAAAASAAPAAPAASAGGHDAAPDGIVELRSPLLGVFYRRPAPDKPPFVEVGSEVSEEDPACIIDVMKMFTRVPAGVDGTVVAILAEDGKLVEHGQVLMHIRPR
jgi:acetyl-CoA carboxylase biotin carboxyl carrier protein